MSDMNLLRLYLRLGVEPVNAALDSDVAALAAQATVLLRSPALSLEEVMLALGEAYASGWRRAVAWLPESEDLDDSPISGLLSDLRDWT